MEQSASSQFFFQDRVGYDSSQSPSGTVTRHVGASNFYMHKDSMDEGSPGSPDSPSSGYRDMQQNSRFPFLKDFCHIHYEHVEPLVLQCELVEEAGKQLSVSVKANSLAWVIHRSWDQVKLLDQKLHHCIYERARSALPDLSQSIVLSQVAIRELVGSYFQRFSNLAHSTINCGTVLNWFEVDNRGNHLIELASTSSSVSFINIPAVAAAQAIREYEAQAPDELSLGFAEYVSVIDMPPPSESKWWRGKKAFQVGLFPSDCVELIQCSKDPAGGTSIRNPTREPPPPSPENMKAVYRKRGKLITTLRNMFNTRLTRSELKNRGIIRERVFGCDLGEYLGNANIPIPYVLNFCAIFIETRCMVDGVYRLTGVYNRVIELRGEFDAGTVTEDTAIAEMDIHAVTAVLKLYFRELPVPLLTTSLYDAFNFAINVSAPSRLAAVKKVVDQLRPPHKRTAKYLFRHLHRMAQHQATTSMGTSNLAVIWGPNLLRCKEDQEGGLSYSILNSTRVATLVTEYLIRHAHQIFSDSPDSTDQIPAEPVEVKPNPNSSSGMATDRLLSLKVAQGRKHQFMTESLNQAGASSNELMIYSFCGEPPRSPGSPHLGQSNKSRSLKTPSSATKEHQRSKSMWRSFFYRSRPAATFRKKKRTTSFHDDTDPDDDRPIVDSEMAKIRLSLRSSDSMPSLHGEEEEGVPTPLIGTDAERTVSSPVRMLTSFKEPLVKCASMESFFTLQSDSSPPPGLTLLSGYTDDPFPPENAAEGSGVWHRRHVTPPDDPSDLRMTSNPRVQPEAHSIHRPIELRQSPSADGKTIRCFSNDGLAPSPSDGNKTGPERGGNIRKLEETAQFSSAVRQEEDCGGDGRLNVASPQTKKRAKPFDIVDSAKASVSIPNSPHMSPQKSPIKSGQFSFTREQTSLRGSSRRTTFASPEDSSVTDGSKRMSNGHRGDVSPNEKVEHLTAGVTSFPAKNTSVDSTRVELIDGDLPAPSIRTRDRGTQDSPYSDAGENARRNSSTAVPFPEEPTVYCSQPRASLPAVRSNVGGRMDNVASSAYGGLTRSLLQSSVGLNSASTDHMVAMMNSWDSSEKLLMGQQALIGVAESSTVGSSRQSRRPTSVRGTSRTGRREPIEQEKQLSAAAAAVLTPSPTDVPASALPSDVSTATSFKEPPQHLAFEDTSSCVDDNANVSVIIGKGGRMPGAVFESKLELGSTNKSAPESATKWRVSGAEDSGGKEMNKEYSSSGPQTFKASIKETSPPESPSNTLSVKKENEGKAAASTAEQSNKDMSGNSRSSSGSSSFKKPAKPTRPKRSIRSKNAPVVKLSEVSKDPPTPQLSASSSQGNAAASSCSSEHSHMSSQLPSSLNVLDRLPTVVSDSSVQSAPAHATASSSAEPSSNTPATLISSDIMSSSSCSDDVTLYSTKSDDAMSASTVSDSVIITGRHNSAKIMAESVRSLDEESLRRSSLTYDDAFDSFSGGGSYKKPKPKIPPKPASVRRRFSDGQDDPGVGRSRPSVKERMRTFAQQDVKKPRVPMPTPRPSPRKSVDSILLGKEIQAKPFPSVNPRDAAEPVNTDSLICTDLPTPSNDELTVDITPVNTPTVKFGGSCLTGASKSPSAYSYLQYNYTVNTSHTVYSEDGTGTEETSAASSQVSPSSTFSSSALSPTTDSLILSPVTNSSILSTATDLSAAEEDEVKLGCDVSSASSSFRAPGPRIEEALERTSFGSVREHDSDIMHCSKVSPSLDNSSELSAPRYKESYL